jgi:hypothetical protein
MGISSPSPRGFGLPADLPKEAKKPASPHVLEVFSKRLQSRVVSTVDHRHD